MTQSKPKSKNELFRDFVAWAGNQKKAAELLACDESTVSLIVNEKRGISPDMALKAEVASGGLFDKTALVWDTAA